jgi:sulfotransferase family protein
MIRAVFVTGMQRSGTTLLDKLLASHPSISLLSQPFPRLFSDVKRRFLEGRGGGADDYPLGDLFLETRYRPQDFADYLASLALDDEALVEIFRVMEGDSGQYTRIDSERLAALLPRLPRDGFAATLAQFYRGLAHRQGATRCGGKETSCEEFAPALLAAGFAVIVALRDPRDVLASLNHGTGREHAGRLKPTLFNLRSWRKSVAVALACEGHAGFLALRYEDLVSAPARALDRIAATLEITAFPADLGRDGLFDQTGREWRGNSSFGPRDGVGDAESRQVLLPPAVARFAEAACWPELHALAYPTALTRGELTEALSTFVDPYPLERPHLASYAVRERLAEEAERLARLVQPSVEADPAYFHFERARQRLAQAVGDA